jgi:oligoribonuclease
LDVSAIKEAAKRWAPIEVIKASPAKAGKHEAKADILESIAEARYYKDMFFAPKTTQADKDVEQPAELPEDAVLPIS